MNEILQDSDWNFIRDLCSMCFYMGVFISGGDSDENTRIQ